MLATLVGLIVGSQTITMTPALGPLRNPLKGWCPYVEEGATHYFPNSMVYTYVSWRELEPEEGKYNFVALEKKWDVPDAQGKHVVFRVYLDYPSLPTGVPQWLIDKGVKMTPYTVEGGGRSPDYNDPRLVKGLLNLVDALGKRYDLNPRVGFIQAGLLGFWGEWHTYPNNELFASDATQKVVIDRWKQAFPNKKIMHRYPANYAGQQPWLGFHDDMIPEDTMGPEEWKFLPKMRANGRDKNWMVAPTGGEMVPNTAQKYMGPEFALLTKAVEEAHFTWIGPYCPALDQSSVQKNWVKTEQIVRRMGYEYQLKSLTLTPAGKSTKIVIKAQNQGVAPFYYPWQVELAVLDKDLRVVRRIKLKDDVRKWLPGPFRIETSIATLTKGQNLGLGIIDPWTKKPGIYFANKSRICEGYTLLQP